MSDIRLVKLGDCCTVVSGATPKTTVASYWDGDIPWATPKDLGGLQGKLIDDTPRKITQAGLRSCAAAMLPVGSVLLSSRAPIGHVAINTTPMATNQGFKSLVPLKGKVDASYLYYWLLASRSHLQRLGNGATIKEISKSVVQNIEIPLPPIDNQRRIAMILDRTAELRAMRQAATNGLNDLARSIFFEMFGDPSSEYLPWSRMTIYDVAEQVTDGEHLTPKREPQGIKLLSARNIRDGYLDLENVDYIGTAEYQRIRRRCDPRIGDILISCSGTIGRVATVEVDEALALVRSAALIRPNTAKVTTEYLAGLLRTPALKARMLQDAKTSSQSNLFQGRIKRLPVPLPPLALQLRFSERIAKIKKLHMAHDEHLSQLDALFASLQFHAFSGRL